MANLTREQLIAYFNEHILYELLMLRYSKQRLVSNPTQIIWNAMFATFNVSARNLYEFLNNKGKSDAMNVHEYRDYAKGFKLGQISKITGTLQLLNAQVFHCGLKRTQNPAQKVTLGRVDEFFIWADSNMQELVKNFDDKFRAEIVMEKANPALAPTEYTGGPTLSAAPRPVATNHIYEVGSEALPRQTHTSHISGGFPNWPPKKKD